MKSSSRLLLLIFIVSGAAGLIFQMVWVRMLGQVLGNSLAAISLIIAAFMAGFAIGGLLFGRRAARLKSALSTYVALEIGIAISATIITLTLPRMGPVMGWLARDLGDSVVMLTLANAGVVGAILLVPTFMMGATLPVLSRYLTSSEGAVGRSIALLYAANTFGAVIGCLLPDFLLVPLFGMQGAALFGVALNLIAAAAANRLSKQSPDPESKQRSESAMPAVAKQVASGSRGRLALVVICLSGLVALGYEVAWGRLNVIFVGGQVFSFSTMLAVYLIGLALGSALVARWIETIKDRVAFLGILELWIGALVILSIYWLPGLDSMRSNLMESMAPSSDPAMAIATKFVIAMVVNVFTTALMVFLPTVILGMTVPVAARVIAEAGVDGGASIGRVYFWNTLGGIPGALVVGFVLIPLIGVQTTLLLLGFASVGLAVVCLVAAKRRPALLIGPAVVIVALIAFTLWLPGDHVMKGIFATRYGPGSKIAEGIHQTFVVVEEKFLGESVAEHLFTDSYSMTSRNFYGERYMKMMAHLPALAVEQPRSACQICFGLGYTLEALASHTELEKIVIVDISPEVFDLYRGIVGGPGVLADPRLRRVVDDGRSFLQAEREMFDVITLEPPPPIIAGVVNLYSREFYEIARRSLAPGGALCQWLPVDEMTTAEGRAMIRAFIDVFPEATLWHGVSLQLMLLGTIEPTRFDLNRINQSLASEPTRSDLARIGITSAEDVLASLLFDARLLVEYCKGTLPIADDRPMLPYSMRLWENQQVDRTLFIQKPNWEALVNFPPDLSLEDKAKFVLEVGRKREMWSQIYERMFITIDKREVASHLATQDILFSELFTSSSGNAAVGAYAGIEPRRLEAARAMLARDPNSADAMAYLARIELMIGDPAAALRAFRRALELKCSSPASVEFLAGRAAQRTGATDEAKAHFNRARELDPSPILSEIIERQ